MTFIGNFLSRITNKLSSCASWVMNRCTSVVVKVMVVVLVLLVSFWLSLFLHLILVQILVPTKSFSWPAYLDLEPDYPHLSSGNLTAVVPLASSATSDTHCILPPPPREEKKRHVKEGPMPVCSGDPLAAPALLTRGQRYSVVVELVLPDSRPNRHHPMFQVQVAMQDARFREISTSRRPLLVPYRSRVQRVAAALLQVPSLLFVSSFPETHTLRTTVYDNFVDDPQRPTRFVQLQLLRTANLQVLSAHVHIHASFTGLRYVLHHHPLLCATVSTLVNMTLLLASVVVLYFRRLESAAQQWQQRKLAKVARLATPRQSLRGEKKAQPCGDPAEPHSMCDIDSELRRKQADNLQESSAPANDEEPSAGRKENLLKRKCSLKQKDFSLKRKHQSHFEEEVLSPEREVSLGDRNVSFLSETSFSLEKKKEDSLQVSELHATENDSSLSKDTKDHSGSKNEDCDPTNESASVAKDETVNYTSELVACSASKTGARKQEIESGEKLADISAVQELGVELQRSEEQESCEVGAGKIGLEASVENEKCALSSAVRNAGSSIPFTEMKEEICASSPAEEEMSDCSSPPDIKMADCTSSLPEVEDVVCALSPPASPVSTTSSDSQSSLGDFTVLN